MSPGPRPTYVPGGILIQPAVWPQQTGRKLWGWLCPFHEWETGSPSNTMWPGPRPVCVPSFVSIHPTVWSPYTNVTETEAGQTERQITDRQHRANRFINGRTKILASDRFLEMYIAANVK